MNTKDDENRINELIAELSECREDERNTQNQILQVISVAGAVLGILLGTSHFTENVPFFSDTEGVDTGVLANFFNSIGRYLTYTRIMFGFSLIIFCTAFAYVIILGVNNNLRYYYIQNLEERLHELISNTSDEETNGSFLHWNAYIAPIITRNLHHIKSSHSALVHASYSIAVFGVTIFSAAMVISLFLKISPKTTFDIIFFVSFIMIALLTVYLFFRTSNRAKEAAQFAWRMARENQIKRAEGKEPYQSEKSTPFSRMLIYLIYPKVQDLQKPCLIILGFLYGFFFMNRLLDVMYFRELINRLLDPMCWLKLVFVVLAFDILAYQARYQINDIRGIEEDKEAEKTNRLPLDACKDSKDAIKISLIVALLKILASITIAILWGGEILIVLLVGLGILLISTIGYEIARAKGWSRLIFFLVGSGYPLRFFVGFFLVVPLKFITFSTGMLCLALWAYGSFASILSWTGEVTIRMEKAEINKNKENDKCFPPSYKKKHFTYIQDLIMDRYDLAKIHRINNRVLPLREEGKYSDPWNVAMLLSMGFLSATIWWEKPSLVVAIVETVIFSAFSLTSDRYHWRKLIPMCIGWTCIIGKMVQNIFFGPFSIWYLLLLLLQMLVSITYFILYYQPQFKKLNYMDMILRSRLTEALLGEHAFYIMCQQKNSD